MNKHIIHTTLIALALILSLALISPAEDMPMGHSGNNGKTTIREAVVANYHLTYDLYVMRGHMEQMPDMESSHHLIVTILSPEGSAVQNATVGYLITAPDGTKQQVMAMSMGDGYGGDINLAGKGTYTISVKALFDDTDLRDSFEYKI